MGIVLLILLLILIIFLIFIFLLLLLRWPSQQPRQEILPDTPKLALPAYHTAALLPLRGSDARSGSTNCRLASADMSRWRE